MKTKRLLFYLALLIGGFAVNIQAQHAPLKPGKNPPGTEKSQVTIKKTGNKQAGLKNSNRYLGSTPAKIATLDNSEGKTAYGFRIYDEAVLWPYYGIVRFNTATPDQMTSKFKKDYSISSGAYGKGGYYVCKTDENESLTTLSIIDLQNGEEKVIGDISELQSAKSMTYDYSTETMYLLQWKVLSKISLTDGKVSDQISLASDLISIACTYDGRLYGLITETSELVEINPANGKFKTIGKTGEYIENMFQSLDFDHETNTLYWAGYGDGGFLATINTQTGVATRIGTLGSNSEIVGLHIPFSLCQADAPAEVATLKSEPDTNGGLSVKLSWKNPENTYSGAALTNLSGVRIYRDGILVKTITPASAGALATYTDQVPSSGKRQYKIVAYNPAGEGAHKYNNVYVGQDYPAEITEVKISKEGQTAVLTWNPPTSGANNGWFDPASVNYKITRYPDQKVLETEYTGKGTYTDSSVKNLDVYHYQIEAFNTSGSSEPVNTPELAVGNHIIPPYSCNFSTQAQFDLWKVIDNNNDQTTWSYDSWSLYASYPGSYEKDADDWLISSPVYLEAGKYYKLVLELDKVTWLETHENLKITLGTEPSVNKQTTILADFPDFSGGIKNINLKADQTGTYYIGLQCYSQKENLGFQLKNVKILPSGLTDIAANSVSLGDSIAPINLPKSYTVEVENKGVATISEYTVELTDADGNSLCSQKVEESLPSNATAKIQIDYTSDKEGIVEIYAKVTATDDTNPTNDITPGSQKVEFKKNYSISGQITDEEGNAISDAFIKLSGFRPFLAKTGQDGTFVMQGVYQSEGYQLSAFKHGFATEKQTVSVTDGNVAITTIQLKCALNKPADLTVTGTPAGNTISWVDGTSFQEFRYDNGIVGGAFGPIAVGPNALVGTVYEQPTRLTGMSWVTDENSGKHETMNVYVFALDASGKPTSNLLFSQQNVPNTDTTWGEETHWNRFIFPYPVEAPNGCFVAVGYSQAFTVFVDDLGQERDEYPFTPLTQYYSDDYTTNNFIPVEETFFPINLFIRAEGAPIGTNQAAQFVEGYKVWRLLSGDEDKTSAWKELTTGIETNTAFNDASWKDVAQGVYRYAIREEYHNGKSSGYVFSEEIQKDMISVVSIEVKTNTSTNETEGAEVILKNRNLMKEYRYETVMDNSGNISFKEVWKGTYDLSIRKNGFDLLEVNGLEIGSNGTNYSFGPYTLKESILAPYNLSLTGQQSDKSRTLNWNLFPSITDDFESHDNFEINSKGKVGWQHFDGDNAFTYALGDAESIYFPNQCKKMACIIFNPFETTPPLTGDVLEAIRPNSGDKFLAFMASSNQLKANDDYLISPELAFEDDFKFSFYARSCEVGVSPEQMKVGYSTTGTNPSDFTWVNEGNFMEVPNTWTQYSFDIPANAKHVTINYMAYDLFMLMIDDIFIGYEGDTQRNASSTETKAIMRDHKCELYLDGNKVAETKGNSHTFSNLSENNKTVGVRTIYPSGSSEIVTIKLEGSSIEDTKANSLQVYFNAEEKCIYIRGIYNQATLFDASGKLLSTDNNSGKIDAGSLSKGVYILKTVTGDNTYIQKININR